MKRVVIAIVLVLFTVTVAHAQTCTPVRVGRDAVPPISNYQETTPGISFVVESTSYPQRSVINYPAITVMSIAASYFGYINVRPGIGGCLQTWYLETYSHYYGLYDLTEGKFVDSTPVVNEPLNNLNCGKAASCPYYDEGPYYNVNVIPGHSYHLWAYFSVQTSVGTSDWENDYVTINIQ